MNRRHVVKLLPLAAASMLGHLEYAESKATCKVRSKCSKPLCLRYLERVREMFEEIKRTESDNLLEAAYHIARIYKNGGTCYNQWDMGHNIAYDLYPDRQGDPGLFTNGYQENRAKDGDLLLISTFGSPLKDPHEKGVFVIGGASPWTAETPDWQLLREQNHKLKFRHFCDLWIDKHITTHGAIMWLPGASVPMGQTSGIMGLMTFWMMNADAVRILARDSVRIAVSGDEPELGENAPYVSLNEPLGRDLFCRSDKTIQ